MNEDVDKIIEGLAKAITTALRDLVRGIAQQSQSPGSISQPSIQLPGSQSETRSSIQAADVASEFTTVPMEIVDRSPIKPTDFTASYSTPLSYFPDVPETPPKFITPPLSLPGAPEPVAPVGTPDAHPRLDTYNRLDIQRGVSTDDPTGRLVFHHEQDAQATRYDQTTDMLYEAMVKQSRIDRDYRQRQYDLSRRILQDANNDYRRLDDLERRHECSRENVTDVNI